MPQGSVAVHQRKTNGRTAVCFVAGMEEMAVGSGLCVKIERETERDNETETHKRKIY